MGVLIAALASPTGAQAQGVLQAADLSAWVGEASARFALPPRWITGVIRRESAFRPLAVSSAGALGLMQVMPQTYQDLRRRYGLGADPMAPRDNVLAGAAYLRELYDRFGPDGFLAAYNAGPTRYLQSLAGAAPLPEETRRYVGQLQQDLGLDGPAALRALAPPTVFPTLDGGPGGAPSRPGPVPHAPSGGGLFAAITPSGGDGGHDH